MMIRAMISQKRSRHLPSVPRPAIVSVMTGILILSAIICAPAGALPSPPQGGFAGHFSQGIPVYWPYHAFFMATGFILLLAGAIVAHRRKADWLKTHRILQVSGAICVLIGLLIGVYMVTLSGFPHLMNNHEVLGAITASLVLVTILVGSAITLIKDQKYVVRAGHRWLGRISLVLLVINIVLGIIVLSLILRR